MRAFPLTTVKGGITRNRVKGAALSDSLYDLLNGHVTAARTVRMRPGTQRIVTLPEGTKGLVAFGGKLYVFATAEEPIDPAEGVEVVFLKPPGEDGALLEKIHFAEPFMGALYVVAEFDDGNVYHYWLQEAKAWEPNKNYRHGELVSPTSGSTGVVFRAKRAGSAYPGWSANTLRQVGDRVEPTIYNDFFYEAVSTTGSKPRSGSLEPEWPAFEGGLIVDSPDLDPMPDEGSTPEAGPPPPTNPLPEIIEDRYKKVYRI
jgi:hypothetical protein